ncbi:MAG: flagellar basal body rod protein FlgC [Myxococcales bacterium]|nr:flagellar basal body rod protein FlgC [Myxococcales bacterium]
MDFFTAMRISSSGLTVQRTRMNVTASNLANVDTTRTPEGGAYRPKHAVVAAIPIATSFQELLGAEMHEKVHGSEVVAVESDATPGRLVYDPTHPDAKEDGYVEMPNISVVSEMVNMVTASRSYEANVSVIQSIKQMAKNAFEIGG